MESRPIFFAAQSYYVAKPQELAQLLSNYSMSWRRIFRLDTITALCLKDFVREIPLYTKDQIDEIMSNPNDHRSRANTRQQLAEKSFKTLNTGIHYDYKDLKSLRTVGLCFPVGEETMYIDLLYCLTGMEKGLVEFVDASNWLIRPQSPEDVWSIQYACFGNGSYGKGKDDEDIPYDRLSLELAITDIDSRAPELREGDERYVEVQIQWPVMEKPPQEPLDSNEDDMDWLTAFGPSDTDLSIPASSEALSELPQDQVGDNTVEATSEYDDPFADLELDSNEADQSLFSGLDSEDSRGPQIATDADQEEEGILAQAASEEVSEPHLATQSDHPTENGGLLSLDINDQTQTDTSASDLAAHAELLHIDQSHPESEPETDQAQQNRKARVQGQSRRKKSKYLLGSTRRPLPEISKSPNPHTEEEMEYYEELQELAISGTYTKKKKGSPPPFGKLHERPVDDPPMASTASSSPQKERPMAASRFLPGLLVSFIQAGVLFLLSLILAIITRPAETPSDDRHSKNESIQLQKEPLSQEI